MAPWAHLSKFSTFLSNYSKYFSPKSPVICLDDQALFMAQQALRQLSARLPSVHPLAPRLQEILRFAEDFLVSYRSMQSDQIFVELQLLRSWLLWLPIILVKENDMSSAAMVLLAQLYTLALAIDISVPELSGAAFGALSISAVKQLDAKFCFTVEMALPGEIYPTYLSDLMELPRYIVIYNRTDGADGQKVLSIQGECQGSPQNVAHLAVRSVPGTSNHLSPGRPGMLNTWQNMSLEDLTVPPSPFLNYGSPVSHSHSPLTEDSPMSDEITSVNAPLSACDSPAYSPAVYSSEFPPESPDNDWKFDVKLQDFASPGGSVSLPTWT